MKKTILMCTILGLGAITANTASAATFEISDETKGNSVVWGSIATGAAVGGPLGALVGTIAGSWMGEKVKEAGQAEGTEEALAQANARVDELSQKLASSKAETNSYQQFALQELQLELLFKTGASELTLPAQLKMSLLASLLIEHPELMIRLDGHADPRGDETYNQTLSDDRVQAVQSFLIAKGIPAERFSVHSHGASQSTATKGDYDSYALERVVKVQLSKQQTQDTYATSH